MMEIQDDKLQQRIIKLRKKQNQMKQSPSRSNIGADSVFGATGMDPESQFQFSSPLTCARNSRRYLNTDRKGRFIDDADIAH